MAQGAMVPGGSTAPRIGEWLGEAFDLFGKEWQTWCGQGAIYLVLGAGPMMAGYAVYMGFVFSMVAAGARSGNSGSPPPEAMMGGMLASMGAIFAGFAIGMLLSLWLLAGMERTAAKQLRGEPITVKDIFSGGDVFLPLVGNALLYGTAVTLGMYACVVPGLLLAGLWMFSTPLIVCRRMGVLEAMRTSWEVTKPHMWMYLVWYFLITIVGSLGAYVLVGAIATLPIMVLAWMISYRDVIGIPGALPSTRAAVPVGPAGGMYPPGAPVPAGQCPSCGGVVYAGSVVCPHCRISLHQAPPPGAPPMHP